MVKKEESEKLVVVYSRENPCRLFTASIITDYIVKSYIMYGIMYLIYTGHMNAVI